LESVLGLITGVMAIVTLIWRDWIEVIFDVDTDKGNGSAEWVVVLILLIVTALSIGGRNHEEHAAKRVPR
jgi:ABC-type Mn2+/Zn2+ transport system permease subunit